MTDIPVSLLAVIEKALADNPAASADDVLCGTETATLDADQQQAFRIVFMRAKLRLAELEDGPDTDIEEMIAEMHAVIDEVEQKAYTQI